MFSTLVLLTIVAGVVGGIYCPGQGPDQPPGNEQSDDSALGAVTLAGIEEKTACPGGTGVVLFAKQVGKLGVGSEYTLVFNAITCNNAYTRKTAAWLDFNGNSQFEEWEKLGEQEVGATKDPFKVSLKFTVPSKTSKVPTNASGTVYVSGGPTSRLRVQVVENGFDPMDPCLNFPYGGVKDFPIIIGGSGGIGGGMDMGDIIMIAVVVVAFLSVIIAMALCFKLKQVDPKTFATEHIAGPIGNFCGLVKGGVLFTVHKCKSLTNKGDTGEYEEL